MAKVTKDRVNMRAGSNINYEIIGQFNKGDLVCVTEESSEWYKIRLPKEIPCYISKDYIVKVVDIDVVRGNSVNIRSGPGLNYTVMAQLNDGTKVKVLKEDNHWYAIESPGNTYGYINREFIQYYMPEDEYISKKKTEDELLIKLTQLQNNYDEELKKNIEDVNLKPIFDEYLNIMDEWPKTDYAVTAKSKIKEIDMKMAEIDHRKASRLLEKEKEIYRERIKEIDSIPLVKLPPPTAEGVIEDIGMVLNRPGTHKLLQDGQIKYYLRAKNVDLLNKYVYQCVYLWGSVENPKNSKYPVIEVENVKTVK